MQPVGVWRGPPRATKRELHSIRDLVRVAEFYDKLKHKLRYIKGRACTRTPYEYISLNQPLELERAAGVFCLPCPLLGAKGYGESGKASGSA